jgi:hypothetical protein
MQTRSVDPRALRSMSSMRAVGPPDVTSGAGGCAPGVRIEADTQQLRLFHRADTPAAQHPFHLLRFVGGQLQTRPPAIGMLRHNATDDAVERRPPLLRRHRSF